MKREFLVGYFFNHGTGTIFMTCKDQPITRELILSFNKYLEEDEGLENPAVFNVIPLGKVKG